MASSRVSLTHEDLFLLDCALIAYKKQNHIHYAKCTQLQDKLRYHAVKNVVNGSPDFLSMKEKVHH